MQTRHDNYYEAIIQLRPKDNELLNFVLDQIENNNQVEISKEEELKTGYDIYVTNQKFAQQLIRKLKKRFKGKETISRKIHTMNRQTSRDVYRLTVCFRLAKQ